MLSLAGQPLRQQLLRLLRLIKLVPNKNPTMTDTAHASMATAITEPSRYLLWRLK